MILELVTAAAMVPATIYGYSERMCGDPGKAVPCAVGATTASGVPFDPSQAHVAIHAPTRFRLRKGRFLCFLHVSGAQVFLPWTDKKGRGGFDFSPKAVEMLGYKPTRHWSAMVKLCPTNMGYSAL
jgi:hypothetical protein